MKVLFIAKNIPTPTKKGNDIIIKIAERLEKRKVSVDFLFPKEFVPFGMHLLNKYRHLWQLSSWRNGNLNIIPLKYYRLPIDRFAFLFTKVGNKKLIKDIETKGYDLMHAHFLFPDAIIGAELKKKLGIPLIVTVRAGDLKLLSNVSKNSHTWKTAVETLNDCDLLLTVNAAYGDYISKRFDIEKALVPHGIDSDIYGHDVKLNNKDIDVLVVSAAIKRKQIEWVIRSFIEYPDNSNKSLVIAGDGPELNNLKEEASGFSNIKFLGEVPHHDVVDLMRRSKIFALPSVGETFGLVYVEAAAQKNAVIAHSGTGIDGIFKPKDGVLFINNYESFKSALFKLLNGDVDWKQMAHKTYDKSLELNWEKVISKYIDLYQATEN